MSLSALQRYSILYRAPHACNAYMIKTHALRQTLVGHRCFANVSKQSADGIPPHLLRKAKRTIPEPYLRIIKQVPPRHKDYFGQGIIAFVFLFTIFTSGVYVWQAYTLKDRLKAHGIIDGANDERWTNCLTMGAYLHCQLPRKQQYFSRHHRSNRTRTRSGSQYIALGKFPRSIDIKSKYTFDTNQVLEEGGTGYVVSGCLNADHRKKVAIKIMPKDADDGGTMSQTACFQNEVDILRRLQHEHIVTLLDVADDSENWYIVLNFGQGGDLATRIFERDERIDERTAARMTRTLLETLRYLHAHNIVHCDLKPENVLFKNEAGHDDIFLIDFGLARIVDDDEVYPDLCANFCWTAPEIATHYLHADTHPDSEGPGALPAPSCPCIPLTGAIWKKADIYAVACMSYAMVTNDLPFFAETNRLTFEKIVSEELVVASDHDDDGRTCSTEFIDFVTKMLCKDPVQRPSIDAALKHPWLRAVQTQTITTAGAHVQSQRQASSSSSMQKMHSLLISGFIRMGLEPMDIKSTPSVVVDTIRCMVWLH